MIYRYPAILEPDEDRRFVVSFPDLPEALTDGTDEAEALSEAADCLSEALASRIVDGENIPAPTPLAAGQHLISPNPTVALKAALYTKLRQRDMTVADLAERLDVDWHQAARLIDPKRPTKLTSLQSALSALGCRITVGVTDEEDRRDQHERMMAMARRLVAYVQKPSGGGRTDRGSVGGGDPPGGKYPKAADDLVAEVERVILLEFEENGAQERQKTPI